MTLCCAFVSERTPVHAARREDWSAFAEPELARRARSTSSVVKVHHHRKLPFLFLVDTQLCVELAELLHERPHERDAGSRKNWPGQLSAQQTI